MRVLTEKFYKITKRLWLNKDKDIALFFWMKPTQFSIYQKEWIKILYSLAKRMFEKIKESLIKNNLMLWEELVFEEIFNIDLIKWYRPERKVEYEFAQKWSVDLKIFMPFIDFVMKTKIKWFSLIDIFVLLTILSTSYVVYYIIFIKHLIKLW